MNVFRTMVGVIVLATGSFTLARGDDKVLVTGDPPLTQQTFDLYQEMWQWYCDIKLTPEQQRDFQKRYIMFWKKRDKASNQKLLATYETMEKEWRDTLKLEGAEQKRKRDKVRDNWMAALWTFKDDLSPFMVSLYDAAYKPGGSNNPILVKVDPPLTQGMVELDMAVTEMLLDCQLTDKQREEYQRLFVEFWKKLDQAERRKRAGNLEGWAKLPTWNNYTRNLKRTLGQTRVLADWAKNPNELTRWLTTLHESLSKPGSTRNPVLVDVEPPLTQLVVDRYCDYLEIMVDLSVSGGFSTQEREILQGYLVKSWKKMTAETRKDLLADLKRWSEEADRGGAAANECIKAMQPKLLTELRLAREDALSLWLLAVRDRETEQHKQNIALIQMKHEGVMAALAAMPAGYWKYNSIRERYEWIPIR
jgi:hypothetical protein